MNGETRRKQILNMITQTKKPLSASRIADTFNVSRQIIVGDVALLRALGHPILSTARGYLLQTNEGKYVQKVAVCHNDTETEKELRLIVALGVSVLDVTVEHNLYGELTGTLNIHTDEDIDQFLLSLKEARINLLSTLTNGIHLHTLVAPDEKTFLNVVDELRKHNLLYESN